MIAKESSAVKAFGEKIKKIKKFAEVTNKRGRDACYIGEAGKIPDIPSRKRNKELRIMKKLLLAVSLAFALALTLGIAACSSGNKGAGDGAFGQLTSAESVYGFSAVSAGMIIDAENDVPATDVPATDTPATDTPATDVPAADVPAADAPAALAGLDGYMALVESLLSEGGYGFAVTQSDREGYTEKMTVSYRDMDGKTGGYVMYYNQILIPDHDDDDDDDDDDWDDLFERDDEEEEEYVIEGVLAVDGTEYAVRGTRSVESERGESESETEFVVDLGGGRTLYVEQSSEEERGESEQEYSYSVRENGRLIERSTFSYETERGETELKMTSYKDGASRTFYFEKETVRGRDVVYLRIGDGQSSEGYFVHTVTDGQDTRYEYEPAGPRR